MKPRTIFQAAAHNRSLAKQLDNSFFMLISFWLLLFASGLALAAGGGHESPRANSAGTLTVSNQPQQRIRMGIDGERLLHWETKQSKTLAQYAVGDLHVEYVRVAINCAYERESGKRDPKAYDEILDEMAALRAANPNIKFFGSPRPLAQAYSKSETTSIWGGQVPWSPYPSWVQTWVAHTNKNEVKWKFQSVNNTKLTQYLADYLNFMHARGFTIDYLDVINENRFIEPATVEFVSTHLNALLHSGVKRPLLVGPSSWSQELGAAWLNSANPATFEIASTHNTGGAQNPAHFVAAARAAGKEAWNTELHGWIGTDTGKEVLNSRVFWEHLRAGFSGIETWLFFGSSKGRDHSMLMADSNSVRTTCKYEIFKEMVNSANGGHYLGVGGLESDVVATAFVKGPTQTVWVLNSSTNSLNNVVFQFAGEDLTGREIAVKSWYAGGIPVTDPRYDIEKLGQASKLTATKATFSQTLKGRSLHCFKLLPKNLTAVK